MNRKSLKPYVLLLVGLFLLTSTPRRMTEQMRGFTAAGLAPIWEFLTSMKQMWQGNEASKKAEEELQGTRLENRLLKEEMQHVKELMVQELQNMRMLRVMSRKEVSESHLQGHMQKHRELMKQNLALNLQATSARVIYRSPSSWSSSLWINKGELHNAAAGGKVIAKNSPVLYGTVVVGVIDYVGKEQSRVRLITDSGLVPSVRAARGGRQRQLLAEQIAQLLDRLALHREVLIDVEVEASFKLEMERIRHQMNEEKESWYLAKGELHGSGRPFWRTLQGTLKGIGFNYDFADEEGPARDLRNGTVQGSSGEEGIALLQVHDLLVTTGMDGVFPPGLDVAEVSAIRPLGEGDYYYQLEAQSLIEDFNDLSLLFIIPPVGYNSEDQPPVIGG